ncbi:membrane protein [Flavobacterium ammoniigenes]|jgi:Skp family chaperone for outer membrane proteins|uniref:Membrane protein n=1 Tax=Flavobacterium ammoniigenes TaxID=1751095 RepID=A0ABM7V333_9FLAO|nr:OmpH family outer membrane protein [Flavobacterium ammoniigenes]BDB53912.1 membrane protein [Flavobacterium ammoniigenes]
MRKQLLFLFLTIIGTGTIQGQIKSTKIGYIDMEYILQNVSNYKEAQNQLEQKAQKWQQEIEEKKKEINKLSESLKTEKPLLTKELIEERETEIKFLEKELIEFQQNRFGANGALIQQKLVLTKPIQDQVFTTVQDIAEAKQFDFIFDKSSDLTMLFAAKRFDISDQVLRVLNRAEKREQLTKKQQKELEEKEKKEDALNENPGVLEREKALEEKKAAREKIIAERKLQQEVKKKEFEEQRKKVAEEKAAKKSTPPTTNNKSEEKVSITNKAQEKLEAAELVRKKQAEDKAKILEERKKIIEEKRKAAEDKRNKIIEERAAAKKAAEEKLKTNTNNN